MIFFFIYLTNATLTSYNILRFLHKTKDKLISYFDTICFHSNLKFLLILSFPIELSKSYFKNLSQLVSLHHKLIDIETNLFYFTSNQTCFDFSFFDEGTDTIPLQSEFLPSSLFIRRFSFQV